MNDYELTIKAETLKGILGEVLYKKLAAGTLQFGAPKDKKGKRPVFVSSIPFGSLSREKRAAILSCSEKRTQVSPHRESQEPGSLGRQERSLLQEMIDERCRVVTERYIEKRNKLSSEYLQDMMKPEFRAALSQYPVPGTDPRTVLYLESFDSLYQDHHDEMRRLLCICETLGLRTNPLLDHVLGCRVRSHRREPQAGQARKGHVTLGAVRQSEEASVPQNHLSTAQRLEELERQRENLLFLVCRILQAHPGYKLHPSELAAENVGDLSVLSRETRVRLFFQIRKGHPFRTSTNDI